MKERAVIETVPTTGLKGVVRWLLRSVLVLPVLALLFGCTSIPIHADRTSVSSVYRELRHSALDSDEYSDATRAVLHRYDWDKTFQTQPVQVLQQLHVKMLADNRPDLLPALVELNYFHANRMLHSANPLEKRAAGDYFLASSIYGYFYLLSTATEAQLNPFDPGPGFVRDFYNRALARAFLVPESPVAAVRLEAGARRPLIGQVEVSLNAGSFPWPLNQFAEIVMADEYSVHGLTVRNRQAGLGAPLILTGKKEAQNIPPPRAPATLFLRVEGALKEWGAGSLRASLELYPGFERGEVRIAGRSFPLEIDATAPWAYALNNPEVWKLGYRQFFSGREIVKSGIYPFRPYRPGTIPVVFVHGTFSSPVAWAEMLNTLWADPAVSNRFQPWVFIYNTGNPLVWSAANLRDALMDTVKRLDPEGRDPALRDIVVIGHSQGGILAKLAVTPTGDKLWRLVSDQELKDLNVPDDIRAQLRRALFVEPVPYVTRVVFVATPHRGSYRATGFIRTLAEKLVSLPGDLLRFTAQVTRPDNLETVPPLLRMRLPTSIFGMSPENPVQLALAEMPPAPGVVSHSIIPVSGRRPLAEDDDGLVAYRSAHVAYAASELVVHAGHSCLNEPAVIEEVRRILLEHLGTFDAKFRPEGAAAQGQALKRPTGY